MELQYSTVTALEINDNLFVLEKVLRISPIIDLGGTMQFTMYFYNGSTLSFEFSEDLKAPYIVSQGKVTIVALLTPLEEIRDKIIRIVCPDKYIKIA